MCGNGLSVHLRTSRNLSRKHLSAADSWGSTACKPPRGQFLNNMLKLLFSLCCSCERTVQHIVEQMQDKEKCGRIISSLHYHRQWFNYTGCVWASVCACVVANLENVCRFQATVSKIGVTFLLEELKEMKRLSWLSLFNTWFPSFIQMSCCLSWKCSDSICLSVQLVSFPSSPTTTPLRSLPPVICLSQLFPLIFSLE